MGSHSWRFGQPSVLPARPYPPSACSHDLGGGDEKSEAILAHRLEYQRLDRFWAFQPSDEGYLNSCSPCHCSFHLRQVLATLPPF